MLQKIGSVSNRCVAGEEGCGNRAKTLEKSRGLNLLITEMAICVSGEGGS